MERIDKHSSEYMAARQFVVEALRTGLMLSDLFANLAEDIPDDSFPGEDLGEVLVEMLTGSIVPATMAAGPETVEAATALLGAASDRTIDDLKTCLEIARER